MSWDCPHYADDICKLNGIRCTPAKGNCVLRGKFGIMPSPKPPWEKKKEKEKRERKKRKKNLIQKLLEGFENPIYYSAPTDGFILETLINN